MNATGESTARRLSRDWLMTTGTSLLIGLIIFIAAPIAANRLGPVGRGTLVTVQLLPQIFADLASVGLGFSIIHFGSQEQHSVHTLWRWSLRRSAVGALVAWTLGQAIAPVITSTAGDERMLRVYLTLCPLIAFTTVPLELLRALGRFRLWNLFTFMIQIAWPTALLLGVLQSTPSLWTVVWAHLSATAIILVALVLTVRRITSSRRSAPSVERPEYLSYGVKSALSTIPSSANAKLDQLVMAAFVSRADLGLYAAAAGWSQLTLPVMRGLIAVSMPFVSGSQDADRPARVRRLVTLGSGAVIILSVGGIGATLILWGPLYGPEYRSALTAALVLMVASQLLQFNGLLGNVLRSLDRPGTVTWIESVVLVLSTIALVVALQISPVLGAAVVSLITYSVASMAYSRYIAARIGTSSRDLVDIGGGMQMVRDIAGRVRRVRS